MKIFVQRLAVVLALVPISLGGCNGLSIRSQSPEDKSEELSEKRQLVGDVSAPFGMFPVRLEAVGLVTNLPGTGSDPIPSPERAKLLSEMHRKGIQNANQILASNATDLVLIRGYLRPGIQKGDKFDLEVRVPTRSENTGLRGGWLMQTRLTELTAAGGSQHEGELAAFAEGPVLVDPTVDAKSDKVLVGRGRVLSGGVSTVTRPLGLSLKGKFKNVAVSSLVGAAINKRFHVYEKGVKVGVAKPKTEEFIELTVHPRYKDNIERFVRVIRSVPIKETPAEELARMQVLERNLLDPITSSAAALKLEAIGKAGIPVLKKGLTASDVEVRFYSAEALAYLDEKVAAQPLGDVARDQPAFRAYALAALGAMDDFDAFEALKNLLEVPSAETRYGAFRGLWAMNKNDALIKDEAISDQFHYHLLKVAGPPMVHFTRNARPEIVLFGGDQRLVPPVSLEAGPRIMINSIDADHLSVSRYVAGEADQKRIISTSIDEMIRAIADLGGTYPDVVQALQQARGTKALAGRLEMEAIPQAGREFEREAPKGSPATGEGDTLAKSGDTADDEKAEAKSIYIGAPAPDLFPRQKPRDRLPNVADEPKSDEKQDSKEAGPSLWQRITGKVASK
ncbi:MAG: flagellar basal body P-ring protein FlgI [Planctomycetia bacterium]|nr:flagellar basal body P-ring protein FlgI [Planctomycetia bacterium]